LYILKYHKTTHMIIKITTPNINVNTFEDVLYKINLSLLTCPIQDNITIDISETNFLDPYTIANLIILLRYLQRHYSNISISLPISENVTGYLNRIRFFQNIPNGVNRSKSLYSKTNFPASDVLLELTTIQKQSDVHNVIDYSVTKIGKILQANLGYTEKDIVSFCTALSETCQNIVDHSKEKGLVCVQKYHKENNYVIIAVSDLGIGIKRSLGSRYDTRRWNHARAIQNALQLGVSRFLDRGKGLYKVMEIVKKYKGKLIIRSGSGRIEIDNNTHSAIVPYFPGTQIYIRL